MQSLRRVEQLRPGGNSQIPYLPNKITGFWAVAVLHIQWLANDIWGQHTSYADFIRGAYMDKHIGCVKDNTNAESEQQQLATKRFVEIARKHPFWYSVINVQFCEERLAIFRRSSFASPLVSKNRRMTTI